MKCQRCGRIDANFHYSSNINGSVTELHLCSECASEMGYDRNPFFDTDMFSGDFFRGIFGSGMGFIPAFGINALYPVAVIPKVGILTENPPRETQDEPDIKVDGTMQKRRELNIIREQMRLAAENEEFEKAMELRDKIKEMEKGFQGG